MIMDDDAMPGSMPTGDDDSSDEGTKEPETKPADEMEE